MEVLFDLDGPILDVSARYYALYVLLAKRYSATCPLSREHYWELKRQRTPTDEILRRSGIATAHATAYTRDRLALIETPEYLSQDRPHPWAIPVLAALNEHRLHLITLRNNRANLLGQLAHFGLKGFFVAVHSRDDNEGTWQAKRDLAARVGAPAGSGTVLIGDTEADILAARDLGYLSVAVESGIRSRELLEVSQPDAIIADIGQLSTAMSNLATRRVQ